MSTCAQGGIGERLAVTTSSTSICIYIHIYVCVYVCVYMYRCIYIYSDYMYSLPHSPFSNNLFLYKWPSTLNYETSESSWPRQRAPK